MFLKRFKLWISVMTLTVFLSGPGGVLPDLQAAEVLFETRESGVAAVRNSIVIPAELGSVQALTDGEGPLLIHIAEVHGQYETQKNIEKILHYLKDQYGIENVLVEGSAFALHPERLHFSDDPAVNRNILDALARKSIASAPELFLAEQDAAVFGIENLQSYVRNGQSFQKVLSEQQRTRAFTGNLKMQIERLTSAYLNKDLRDFLNHVQDFDRGTLSFPQWIDILQNKARDLLATDLENPFFQAEWPMLLRVFTLNRIEKEFDASRFENERDAFLKAVRRFGNSGETLEQYLELESFNQQLPAPATSRMFETLIRSLPENFDYTRYPQVNLFIGHLILHSELEFDKLAGEMDKLFERVAEAMTQAPLEKEIIRLLLDYRLFSRLLALELTPLEYEQVLARKSELRPDILMTRFMEINRDRRVLDLEFGDIRQIEPLYEEAFIFYGEAKQRDQDMIRNVENLLRDFPEGKAALITGGFHAGPFYRYFSNRGYRYVSVQPVVHETGENANYQRLILDYYSAASGALKATYRNIPYLATTADEARALGVRGISALWQNEIMPVVEAGLRSEQRSDQVSADTLNTKLRSYSVEYRKQQAEIMKGLKDEKILKAAYRDAEAAFAALQAEKNIFSEDALSVLDGILHSETPKNRNGREALTRLLFYAAKEYDIYILPMSRAFLESADEAPQTTVQPAAGQSRDEQDEADIKLPRIIELAEKIWDQYHARGSSDRADLIAFMDLWFKQNAWHRFSKPTNRTIKSFNAYRKNFLAGDRSQSAGIVEKALREVAGAILDGYLQQEFKGLYSLVQENEDLLSLSSAAAIVKQLDLAGLEQQFFLIAYAYRIASTLRVVKGEQADISRMVEKFKLLTGFLERQGWVEHRLIAPLLEQVDESKPAVYHHVTTHTGVFGTILHVAVDASGETVDVEKITSLYDAVDREVKRSTILKEQKLARFGELLDSLHGDFKTFRWDSPVTAAPVRNKLLNAEIVKQYANIYRILSQDFGFQGEELIYPLGGPDISTALLVSNARIIKIFDRLSFKGTYPESDILSFRPHFLREKGRSGYHSNFFLSFINSASQMLVWELTAVGASDIRIDNQPDANGAYSITFKWSYDGKSEPVERRILYYEKELDLNELSSSLSAELSGDLYLSKANFDRGLPENTKLPPFILSFQKVEREGYRAIHLSEALSLNESRNNGYASLAQAVLLVRDDFGAERSEFRSIRGTESGGISPDAIQAIREILQTGFDSRRQTVLPEALTQSPQERERPSSPAGDVVDLSPAAVLYLLFKDTLPLLRPDVRPETIDAAWNYLVQMSASPAQFRERITPQTEAVIIDGRQSFFDLEEYLRYLPASGILLAGYREYEQSYWERHKARMEELKAEGLIEGFSSGRLGSGEFVLAVKKAAVAPAVSAENDERSEFRSEETSKDLKDEKQNDYLQHRVRTHVELAWILFYIFYGLVLGSTFEFVHYRSQWPGNLPAGVSFLIGLTATIPFIARSAMRLRQHYREMARIKDPGSKTEKRSEQRNVPLPTFEAYERLENFWMTLDHAPRHNADGTVFVTTPFPVLSYVLKLIGTQTGNLAGKNYFSLGAGSLSDSLVAASLFDMNVSAVELDARLSDQARETLDRAVEEGIPGAQQITFQGRSDAFDLDWSEQDVIYFFYTQPNQNAADEERVRNEMGRRFAEKIREMKPGAVLAFLFTGAQVFAGQAEFSALQDIPHEDYQVSEGMTGLYLHLYTVPQRSEDREKDEAENLAVQLLVQIQQELVTLAPKMTEVLRDIPRPESPELETTRRGSSGGDYGLFDDLPWKETDDEEEAEQMPEETRRSFVSFERVEPLRESFDRITEWFEKLQALLNEEDPRIQNLGRMLQHTRSQMERIDSYRSGGGPRNELRYLAFSKDEIPELLHDIRNSLGALTMYMDRLAELLPDEARQTDIFRRYSRLTEILFPPVADADLTVEDMAGIFEQIGELTREDNVALFNQLIQNNIGTAPDLDEAERQYQIRLRDTISDLLRESWFVHALSESSLGREDAALSQVDLHEILDRFSGMNSRLKEAVVKDYGSGQRLSLVELDGTVDSPKIYLLTHELSLIRILKNLIGNAVYAVKDRDKDAQIVFKTRLVDGGVDVEITIADNGTGIKPDDLSRIWDAYFTTKGSEGTGLGLHIVRQTVEETLGGSIRVVSEEGKGTSFTLKLPLEAAAEEEPAELQPLVSEGLVTRGIRFLTPEMYLDIRRRGFRAPADREDDSGGVPSKFPHKVSLSISSDRLFRSSGTHEYGPFARPHENQTIPFGEHASFVVSPQYIREHSDQFELAGRILDKDNLMRGDYQKGLALTGLDEKQVYIKSETAFPDEIHADFVAPEALDGMIVSEKLASQIREWDRRYGLDPLPLYLVNNDPFAKKLEPWEEAVQEDIIPFRQRAELRTLQADDAREAAEYFENIDFLTTFNDIFNTDQAQRSLQVLSNYPVAKLLDDFLLLDPESREYRLTVAAISLNLNLLAIKELRRLYDELDPAVNTTKRGDIIKMLRVIQYYAVDVQSDPGTRFSIINRRTWDNRSDRTLRTIEEMIRELPSGQVRIADMAVSDGTSSYEMARRLESQGVDFSIRAFDRFTEINFFRTDQFFVVFDDERRILQMITLEGRLFHADPETTAFQTLAYMIESISDNEKAALQLDGRVETVSLINPEAAAYAAAHPERLSYGRHDVFEPLEGSYAIVRVLGLLMRGSYAYFSDERIREALRHLGNALNPEGFLINGTLWRDGHQLDSYQRQGSDLVYRDDLSEHDLPNNDWRTLTLRSEQRTVEAEEEPPYLIEDNGPRENIWKRISARFALEKIRTGGSAKVYKSQLFPAYLLKKKEIPKTEIFRIEAPWNLAPDYTAISAELAAKQLAVEEKPLLVKFSDRPEDEPLLTNLTWQKRVYPVDAVWDNRLQYREAMARGVNGFLRKLLRAGYFDADFKLSNLAVYNRGRQQAVGLIDFDFVYHLPESNDPEVIYQWLKDREFKKNGRLHLSPGEHFVMNFVAFDDSTDADSIAKKREVARLSFLRKIIFKDMNPELVRLAFERTYERARRVYSGLDLDRAERKNPPVEKVRIVKKALLDSISSELLIDDAIRRLAVFISEVRRSQFPDAAPEVRSEHRAASTLLSDDAFLKSARLYRSLLVSTEVEELYGDTVYREVVHRLTLHLQPAAADQPLQIAPALRHLIETEMPVLAGWIEKAKRNELDRHIFDDFSTTASSAEWKSADIHPYLLLLLAAVPHFEYTLTVSREQEAGVRQALQQFFDENRSLLGFSLDDLIRRNLHIQVIESPRDLQQVVDRASVRSTVSRAVLSEGDDVLGRLNARPGFARVKVSIQNQDEAYRRHFESTLLAAELIDELTREYLRRHDDSELYQLDQSRRLLLEMAVLERYLTSA